MSSSVELYGTAYGNFATQALKQVRRETYGEDLGQSSWVTSQEYRRFFDLLGLAPADHVLDVGCGPGLFLARERGCRVTGSLAGEVPRSCLRGSSPRVAQATQLRDQQQVLVALGFPTPAQLLAEILPPLPNV